MRRILCFLGAGLLLLSCGGRTAKTPAQPVKRAFPEVSIPAMLSDGQDRVNFMISHLWDKFTDTSAVYYCDSVTVNGVDLEEVERQMGLFGTLLQNVSISKAKDAVAHFFGKVEAFGRRYPESNMFPKMSELLNKYLYDPDTGMRFTNSCTPPFSALNLHPLKGIPRDLDATRGCDFVGYGNHEQYFFKEYMLYQPDYMEREMLVARTLKERGYRFIFMEELI